MCSPESGDHLSKMSPALPWHTRSQPGARCGYGGLRGVLECVPEPPHGLHDLRCSGCGEFAPQLADKDIDNPCPWAFAIWIEATDEIFLREDHAATEHKRFENLNLPQRQVHRPIIDRHAPQRLVKDHIAASELGRRMAEHAPMHSAQARPKQVRRYWARKNVVCSIVQKDLLALLRAGAKQHKRGQAGAGGTDIPQQRSRSSLVTNVDHNGIVRTTQPCDLTNFMQRLGEIENEAVACRRRHVVILADTVGA